jgi:hypothetical protein
MKKFLSGYGQINPRWFDTNDVEIPTAYLIYQKRLIHLLRIALATSAASALLVTFPPIRDLLAVHLHEYISPTYIPFLKRLCPSPFSVSVGAWYLLMIVQSGLLISAAVARIPYSTLPALGMRIKSLGRHAVATGILIIFCALAYYLFIQPIGRCRPEGTILGHGDLIMRTMTSHPLGLAVLGPLSWAFVVCIFLCSLSAILTGGSRLHSEFRRITKEGKIK